MWQVSHVFQKLIMALPSCNIVDPFRDTLKSWHLSNEGSAYYTSYVHEDVYIKNSEIKDTSLIRTLGPVSNCPKSV